MCLRRFIRKKFERDEKGVVFGNQYVKYSSSLTEWDEATFLLFWLGAEKPCKLFEGIYCWLTETLWSNIHGIGFEALLSVAESRIYCCELREELAQIPELSETLKFYNQNKQFQYSFVQLAQK